MNKWLSMCKHCAKNLQSVARSRSAKSCLSVCSSSLLMRQSKVGVLMFKNILKSLLLLCCILPLRLNADDTVSDEFIADYTAQSLASQLKGTELVPRKAREHKKVEHQ